MKKAIIFSFLLLSALLLKAQVNDNCANAIRLDSLNQYCSAAGAYTNVGATDEGIPNPSCWVPLGTINDVWFSFVAIGTHADISLTAERLPRPAPRNNPQMALYSGTCGSLTESKCGTRAIAKDSLVIGDTYYIRVDMTGSNSGPFSICIDNFTPFLNPIGDCDSAINLCSKDPVSSAVVNGPGYFQEGQGSCLDLGNAKIEVNTVWYTWTCDTAGSLEFWITPSKSGDDIDFAFYELAPDCSNKINLRCNAASCRGPGNIGITGLDTSATNDIETAGCGTSTNQGMSSFSNPVNLTAGKSYALQINNYSANRGFSLTFGGTATFAGVKTSFTSSPTTGCIIPGTPITFTSTTVGATIFNWTFGPDASIQTFSGPAPPPVTFNIPGTYTVTLDAQTAQGCTGTFSQTIVVGPPPAAPIVTSPITYCQGATAVPLTATGTSLLWYIVPSGGTGSAAAPTPDTSVPASTTYYVSQSIGGCESALAPIIVDVTPAPTISIPPKSICIGQTDTLTATPSIRGGTYSWSPGNETTPSITVSPTTATTYICVYDLAGCKSSDTVTVNITTNPTVTINSPTICQGDTASLTATTSVNGGTYAWQPGGETTATIKVNPYTTSTYACTYSLTGCSGSASATVTVNSLPVITISPNADICEGNSIVLTAGGADTYTWNPGSIIGSTINVNPLTTVIYTVDATDINLCKGSNQVTVTVYQPPTANAGANLDVCKGDNIQLNAMTGSGWLYSWDPTTGLSNPAISNPVFNGTDTTTYVLSVSVPNGVCPDATDTVTVNVQPVPIIFAGADTLIQSGDSVLLAATTTSFGSVKWFPATSLNCDTCLTTVATPQATTVYTVTISQNGCSSSDAVIVSLEEIFTLYIPSSFSQQSSSINRIFKAYGTGVNEFQFYIFNRWGDVVFETNDITKGWDGSISGVPVEDEVYVYFVKALSLSGRSITRTGSVTIIN